MPVAGSLHRLEVDFRWLGDMRDVRNARIHGVPKLEKSHWMEKQRKSGSNRPDLEISGQKQAEMRRNG